MKKKDLLIGILFLSIIVLVIYYEYPQYFSSQIESTSENSPIPQFNPLKIFDTEVKCNVYSNTKWIFIFHYYDKGFLIPFDYSGEGNHTFSFTENSDKKATYASLRMNYAYREEIPNGVYVQLDIIKKGSIIFRKKITTREKIEWEK